MSATGALILLNSDRRELPERLSRRSGLPVHLITTERYRDHYGAGPDVSYVRDWHDLTAVRAAALHIAAQRPVRGVAAATEKSVPAAGLVRSALQLPGPGYDRSLAFSHKDVMKRRLGERGIRVARCATAYRLEDVPRLGAELGWPVVVKPVTGASARHVVRLDGPSGSTDLGPADPAVTGIPLLVEEHLEVLAEYHVDAVIRNDQVVFHAVSRYFAPVLSLPRERRGSFLLPDGSPSHPELTALLHRVVAALRPGRGVVHLECLETPDGLHVGEIAARPGGGGIPRTLHEAYGVDLWDEVLAGELDEERGAEPAVPERVHAWARVPVADGAQGFEVICFSAATADGVRERYARLQRDAATAGVQEREGVAPWS
ncbi:acetyl-CoA carboxylase biotin carboxylase subunit family protein [Kitasatospora sp. NPDC101157]|uniref:ATP-grasp domain-containing protein n=1 Tax=Kitasatospora sp. NPDC101157 TaxID=3364098 RepID=UPI00381B12A7